MATIVISASGTWGDFLPLLAVGVELGARGHRVRVAANSALHALARGVGLEPLPCGPVFGAAEANKLPQPREGWTPVIPEIKKAEAYLKDTPLQFRDLLTACDGAELLVAHSFQYAAMLVHNRLRIPWVCVSPVPSQFKHHDYAACTQPAPRATLNLFAGSEVFSPPDLGFTEYIRTTGFLFFDGGALPDWRPTAELKAFVEEGEKVLVLALGCIPGPQASLVATLAARAAVQLKRKLVLQQGWAELDTEAFKDALDSGWVRLAGPLSHDWIFSRADAVIHHCGAGLCARTLRAGVPSLVLPQRSDQFFNARWMVSHGAGAAMAVAKLSEEGFARMLEERVLSASCRDAARALSAEIQKEDGTRTACNLIEALIKP